MPMQGLHCAWKICNRFGYAFLGAMTARINVMHTKHGTAVQENGKKVLTMTDFYFAIGQNPKDVFVVVGEKWILYKHCETEDLARAIVEGQNKRREGKR